MPWGVTGRHGSFEGSVEGASHDELIIPWSASSGKENVYSHAHSDTPTSHEYKLCGFRQVHILVNVPKGNHLKQIHCTWKD